MKRNNLNVKKFFELSSEEVYEILRARAQIFIVEQGMNCLDPDGDDYNALHMFFKEEGRVTAYLRALRDKDDESAVKIGRVLTLTHGIGLGRKLIESAIPELKKCFSAKKVILHSQKTAIGFYKKLGFIPTSEEFFEEGIAHISMELKIYFN